MNILKNKKLTYTNTVADSIDWCHWFVLFNVFISILIGIRYLLNTFTHTTVMGTIYEVINLLGHFWFLNFIIFLILYFPFAFIIANQKAYRIIVTILAIFAQTLLIIDTQLYHNFSFHINIQLIQIFTENSDYQSGMNFNFLMILFPILVVIEIVLARYAIYKHTTKHSNWIPKTFMITFVSCFACTHIMHIWADSTKYEPIMTQESMFPLSYPMTARSFLSRNTWLELPTIKRSNDYYNQIKYPLSSINVKQENIKNFNYVIIGIRGWNFESLNENVMPYTNKLKDNSIFFSQHYATSTDPSYSMFSFFYGLNPQYRSAIIHDQETPLLIDELQRQTYKIARFITDSAKTINLENSEIFYGLRTKNQETLTTDKDTISKAISFFNNSNKNEDNYFLYVSLEAPSILRNELGIQVFKPSIPANEIVKAEPYTNKDLAKITNGYFNSIYSTDKEIEKLVETIKNSSVSSKTIIIIVGETGFSLDKYNIKSFGTSGDLTYGNLHVPMLIIYPNSEAKIVNHMTSHTDVAPTIMSNELGVINDTYDYSNGHLLSQQTIDQYVIGGTEEKVAIIDPSQITTFSKKGYYKVTDCVQKNECKDSNIQMSTLMRVMKQLHKFYDN